MPTLPSSSKLIALGMRECICEDDRSGLLYSHVANNTIEQPMMNYCQLVVLGKGYISCDGKVEEVD